MDRGHEGNFLGLEFWPPDISTRNAEARLVGVGKCAYHARHQKDTSPVFLFFIFLGSTRAKVWLVRRWVLPFENTKGTF